MQGLFRFACSNRSRTRLAPTPTNISTNSEPLMLKKGTPASPENRLGHECLSGAGRPDPIVRLWGCAHLEQRISAAPSEIRRSPRVPALLHRAPATSPKVTEGLSPTNMRALLFPKESAWLLPLWLWRNRNRKRPAIRIKGSKLITNANQFPELEGGWTLIFTWAKLSPETPMPCSVRVRATPSSLRLESG